MQLEHLITSQLLLQNKPHPTLSAGEGRARGGGSGRGHPSQRGGRGVVALGRKGRGGEGGGGPPLAGANLTPLGRRGGFSQGAGGRGARGSSEMAEIVGMGLKGKGVDDETYAERLQRLKRQSYAGTGGGQWSQVRGLVSERLRGVEIGGVLRAW